MSLLILMRHGQSKWNLKNIFTGWVDVPLSEQGIKEALQAGAILKNIPIDIIFTSSLIRAMMTAMLAMSVHGSGKVPVVHHPENLQMGEWGKIYGEEEKETIPVFQALELNERMYGQLQGKNKDATVEEFGADLVKLWRRSYDLPPPKGESLKMTAERTLPFFNESIKPHLSAGKNVFVSAHGNSLRSIMMEIEHLSKEEVLQLEIPTGKPIIYHFENHKFVKND